MALVGGKSHSKLAARANNTAEHGELWIVSYADMVTLLFGFFVILFSLSQVDDKKFNSMAEEMAESFKGDVASKKESDQGLLMEARQIRALQMLVAMLNLGENVEQAVENIERKVAAGKSMEVARDLLMKDIKQNQDQLRELQLAVTDKSDQIEIALPDTMLFESGTADLTPKARVGLKSIASYLMKIQGLTGLEVVGHTDSLPPARSSKFPSNWALSAARAGAVAEELLRHGVSSKSLVTRGMASLAPLFPERRGDGSLIPQNLPKNRRVSIIVKKAHYEPVQK